MSMLMRAIKECMSGLHHAKDDSLSANFIFPEDFLGFKGHFPGKPVLPGVCKIQAAILMLEEAHQKPARLKEVALAKFFAPVTFGEELTFDLKETPTSESEADVKVSARLKDKKIAALNLKITWEK